MRGYARIVFICRICDAVAGIENSKFYIASVKEMADRSRAGAWAAEGREEVEIPFVILASSEEQGAALEAALRMRRPALVDGMLLPALLDERFEPPMAYVAVKALAACVL